MDERIPAAVGEVLMSGFIGQGKKVEELEEFLVRLFEHPYIATTNSATSAESLAWEILKLNGKVEVGDTVLCSPLTCMATNLPIVLAGLKIKWVDIDPETLNIDLFDLQEKIDINVTAAQIVHWGGYPVDVVTLWSINNARQNHGKHPIVIVEDAAHAMGSTLRGKPLGAYGNMATYSLQAIKHITSVDGGFLILPSKDLYRQARLLRWYGIDRDNPSKTDFRCETDVPFTGGSKWHMNDINATIARLNFDNFQRIIGRHKSNSAYYDRELQGITGLKLLKREQGFDSACWIYSMLVEDKKNFMKAMIDKGIMVSQVHERNDKHTCFNDFKADLPNLDYVIPRLVNIPVHWDVSDEQRQYIKDSIKEGW